MSLTLQLSVFLYSKYTFLYSSYKCLVATFSLWALWHRDCHLWHVSHLTQQSSNMRGKYYSGSNVKMTLRSNSWPLDCNTEMCTYSSAIYLVQVLTWYKPNLGSSNSPSEEKMSRKGSATCFVSHSLLTFFPFSAEVWKGKTRHTVFNSLMLLMWSFMLQIPDLATGFWERTTDCHE